MIYVLMAAATALGQSSQPAGDETMTPETIQKAITHLMDQRQQLDGGEHARQVAEHDREMAQRRQAEIDAQAKKPLQSLRVFLFVVAGFWIFLVVASIRRQRTASRGRCG